MIFSKTSEKLTLLEEVLWRIVDTKRKFEGSITQPNLVVFQEVHGLHFAET